MNDITVNTMQLPDTIEELAGFVFVGREKLTALKAAIKACNRSEVISEKLNQMKEEEMLLAENVLIAEMRIGELLKEVPKAKGGRGKTADNAVQGYAKVKEEIGISQKQAQRYQVLANHPDLVEEAIENARAADRPVTRQEVLEKVSPTKREQEKADLAKAMESHRRIQKESEGELIHFHNGNEEKENFKVFAHNFKDEISYWLPRAVKLDKWNEKDLKRIVKELSPEARQDLAQQISIVTKILCRIGKELINEKR